MSDVAVFLLARIAEDEEEVGWVYPDYRDEAAGPNGIGWAEVGAISEVLMTSVARVLADCAAKRAIVENHLRHIPGRSGYGASRDAVRSLAGVYSGHPDYDPAWVA